MNGKWKRVFWDWVIPFILVAAIGWCLILLSGCASTSERDMQIQMKSQGTTTEKQDTITKAIFELLGTIQGIPVDLLVKLTSETTKKTEEVKTEDAVEEQRERMEKSTGPSGGIEDLLKTLGIGGGGFMGILGLIVGFLKVKNSEQGKIFGPMRKPKESNP